MAIRARLKHSVLLNPVRYRVEELALHRIPDAHPAILDYHLRIDGFVGLVPGTMVPDMAAIRCDHPAVIVEREDIVHRRLHAACA